MEDKIKIIMSEILCINQEEITDKTSLHIVKKWDSQQHMVLIVALEREFHIKFDDDEIPTMIDYPMIVSTIASYLV